MKNAFYFLFLVPVLLILFTLPVFADTFHLFDIVLSIESGLLNKSGDLIARTQFVSFGTAPTPVNMVYRIEDANGKRVYSESQEITVETEQLVTKKFNKLNLENGRYILFLSTIYGNNISDEFRKSFEVGRTSGLVSKTVILNRTIAILTIISGFVIYLIFKRKKKIKKVFKLNKSPREVKIPWHSLHEGTPV